MTGQIKVSVILTSYNHAKYLRESINSILNQTFSDFELNIWDDASTDESWQIINTCSDPRIRTFRNEINRYVDYLNEAISDVAMGQYIAIHHSDDVWEPEKLEKQVAFLDDNPQVGAVFTWAQIIDEHGHLFQDQNHFYNKVFEQPNRTRHEWLNFFFYHGNALCHPSVLIRRQCYEDAGLYRYGMAQIPDLDMWVRLCLKHEIHILPEKLVRFRIREREANASGNRPEVYIRNQFEFLQVYSHYLEVTDRDEFLKIFPSSSSFLDKEDFDISFALAMTALSSPHEFGKLFGLQLLFDALNNPEHAKKIEKLYGFRHVDLINLTAKHDIFSVIAIPELWRQLAEHDRQIASLNQAVAMRDRNLTSLSSTLSEIYSSRIWRVLAPLRWYGRQRQSAAQLIRAMPILLSHPGGVFALFKNFVNAWRQDGWSVVNMFARQYLDRIAEPDAVPAQAPIEIESEVEQRESQRPEILFVSHEASRTGAPILLLELIRFLSNRLDIDFVILLRSGGELVREFRKLGTTIVLADPYKLDPLVLQALKKRNIKLVYSNTITNGTVQMQLKQLGCPILCHVHELAFSIRTFYGEKNLKQVLDTTTKFLAASEAVAENLREQLHLPEERIVVAHEFISTQVNLDTLEKMAPPLNMPRDAVVVGASGTIGWRKGTDLFLQVARLVLAKTDQLVFFVWVGGPLSRGEHINLSHDAKLMGIDKNIVFTGNVTSPMSHFAQFDVFVLPSREDPFPLVALEAASLGIPIVCFDRAGGTPELVEEDAGIVVPYLDIERMAEAVRQLIEDSALRTRLGERAQKKVRERHDTSVGGEHIARIIQKFL